jgi:hypothetical protein
MRGLRIAVAAGLVLAAAFGCDLLKSATTFTVDTDWQQLTVDSASLGLTVPSGSVIPGIPCTAAADPCATATSQISCVGATYSCKVQCGASAKCEVVASAESFMPIDLSQKVKSGLQSNALNKVTVRQVIYNTDDNTLNFDTPKIELFVGPSTATKTTDAGVVAFATMDPIPRGTKPNAEIIPTDAGKEALAGFVRDYQTPFRLLAKASLRFATGDSIPQGRLALKVKAYLDIVPLN